MTTGMTRKTVDLLQSQWREYFIWCDIFLRTVAGSGKDHQMRQMFLDSYFAISIMLA